MRHLLQLLAEKLLNTPKHDSLCEKLLVLAKAMIFHGFSRLQKRTDFDTSQPMVISGNHASSNRPQEAVHHYISHS